MSIDPLPLTDNHRLILPTIDMPPRVLLGAGPSNCHPRVLAAMIAPTVGHLDPAFLKKMLPMVAMLVAGVMAKQGAGQGAPSPGGGLGDLLGGLLGGGQMPGQGGASGLASMLDLDRDGNPLDDIIGMAGRFLR